MKSSSRMRSDDADSFQSLWRMASSATLHGAFCACAGGGAFAISPQQLEEDILDYLAERYVHAPDVTDALRRRRENRSVDLVKWMEDLVATDNLSDATADAIRGEVAIILRSIVMPEAGFFCR